MATKTHKKRDRLSAQTADKHDLYQRSVQSPDTDALFFSEHFQKTNGRPLRLFREDFCGTAAMSCEFVKLHRENHAIGVDLHAPTLAWGKKNNIDKLKPAQRPRVTTLEANVLDICEPKADMIAATNFSYMIFKKRQELLAYIKNAHRSLSKDGLLLMDIWGGSQTQVDQEDLDDADERDVDGEFTYYWQQCRFDPLSYDIECRIHFEFNDGTRMLDAFTYEWRMWTIPEIRELMEEAGFRNIHVLWEGTEDDDDDDDGDEDTQECETCGASLDDDDDEGAGGNGEFTRVEVGEADDAWIAYVVGQV